MPRFGVHNSIAGGLTTALAIGVKLRCQTMQMFVRNQRQWRADPLTDAEVAAWKAARAETDIAPVLVHDNYLINLACPEEATRTRSIEAFGDELDRCDTLGIEYLVMHPGSHLGAGEGPGLDLLIASLDRVLAARQAGRVGLLLETTAGQGTNLGWRFEQLAEIIKRVGQPARFGVCLDTCHVFAAGYDIRTPEAVATMADEFDRVIGLARLRAIHINDSKRELGSRVDRHEHIGKGLIGERGLWSIIHEPRLADLPMILETPKGDNDVQLICDRRNLTKLRKLAAQAG
ncbi:MAG: deoxyribonuclease IV [Phycisphaerae bacterium]|nr:deoxyribonuclease IV [Phycisphaerae bacterium]